MNRRDFLTAAAMLPLIGSFAPAMASAAGGGSVYRAFREGRAHYPWLSAFNTAAEAYDCARCDMEGRLPTGLRGTLYRNGPAMHEKGGRRYRHWFDGDGMVQAFHLTGQGVSHRGRFVATEKFVAERQAGRMLYPGFATSVESGLPVRGPDSVNVANINVISHAGGLYALWEGGSAHEMEAESLGTRGIKTWAPQLRGMPFSAHPHVDRDGTLWNFGYEITRADMMVLYRIGADGVLRDHAAFAIPGLAPVHDFVVTGRHLVFLIPPVSHDHDRDPRRSFLDGLSWHEDAPTRILIVEKDDLSKRRWLEMPANWVFHFADGWEESDGTIRLNACLYEDAEILFSPFRAIMRGEVPDMPPVVMRRISIRPSGTVMAEDTGARGEFPRTGIPVGAGAATHVVMAEPGSSSAHPLFNRLVLWDGQREQALEYRYGDTEIAEEHIIVTDDGGQAKWILGTSHDFAAGRTRLNVFDIATFTAGPVCRATLPYALPLGLHGNFVPA